MTIIYRNIRLITITGTILPLIAMLCCTVMWITDEKERDKANYCGETRVYNFWPILSDAIGASMYTILLWNILIWIDAPIRFIGSRLLYNTYCRLYESKRFEKNWKSKLFWIVIFLTHHINNLEIVFLLILSSVPVNIQHETHSLTTFLFILFTLLFCVLSCCIEYVFCLKKMVNMGLIMFNLYWLRYMFAILFGIGFISSIISYQLYHSVCINYTYSALGLSEVALVMGSVLIHGFVMLIANDFFIIEELEKIENQIESNNQLV